MTPYISFVDSLMFQYVLLCYKVFVELGLRGIVMIAFKKTNFAHASALLLAVFGNAWAVDAPTSTPPAPLDQAIRSVGGNLEKNPGNPGLENALDHLKSNQERLEQRTTDRLEGAAGRPDRLERAERPEHAPHVERPEHVDRPEHLDRPGRN